MRSVAIKDRDIRDRDSGREIVSSQHLLHQRFKIVVTDRQ